MNDDEAFEHGVHWAFMLFAGRRPTDEEIAKCLWQWRNPPMASPELDDSPAPASR